MRLSRLKERRGRAIEIGRDISRCTRPVLTQVKDMRMEELQELTDRLARSEALRVVERRIVQVLWISSRRCAAIPTTGKPFAYLN